VAENIVDQGAVWWPAGLPAQETVRIVFNVALQNRPTQVTCIDYDSRASLEAELVNVERSGTRGWARYTAATLRFMKPEQRGKSFRWRALEKV
jgi:hypothetical protein